MSILFFKVFFITYLLNREHALNTSIKETGSRLYPAPDLGTHGRTPLGLWGWDSCDSFSEKTKRDDGEQASFSAMSDSPEFRQAASQAQRGVYLPDILLASVM
jgi:hypothetical protein